MVDNELTDEDLSAIRDLIQRSELRAIEFHEVSARTLPFDGEPPAQEDANVSIQLEHRAETKEFGIRMIGSVTNSTKEVRVAVAAEYDMTAGETPVERTILMFANEVAVMSLCPYFREGVSSVSAKVFNDPLLLPTIERGMIKYDISDNV